MHQREVVGIGGVFQLDLPVARKAETVLARNLDAVAGALFHEQVDPLFRRTEEVLKRFDVVFEGGKNHPGVTFHTQAHQRQFRLVDAVGVTFRVRDTAQRTVQGVTPAVVRADEAVGLALFVLAYGGAAVTATVEQNVDVLFTIAHHDHRLFADKGGLVVACFRHLAFVCDPYPGAIENLLQFGIKQRRIGIQRGVDTVGLHQLGRIDCQVNGGNQIAHGISLPACKPATLHHLLQSQDATVGPCFCKWFIALFAATVPSIKHAG
ncbi:hypothetical protein D3C78_781800 [compost metagenome]